MTSGIRYRDVDEVQVPLKGSMDAPVWSAENCRGPWGLSKDTGQETRGKALATGLES